MDLSTLLVVRISGTFNDTKRGLEVKKGLKVSFPGVGSLKDTAKSNIGFLEHLVLPLYSGLCDLEDRFK